MSVVLAYAVGVTVLAWALLAFQFVGLGLLILRIVGRPLSLAAGFTAFWLGFAVTMAHLQIWSLFLPVTPTAMAPLLGLSVVGWVRSRQTVFDGLTRVVRAKRWSAAIGLLCLWAAIYAQVPLLEYDAGIYHLGAIRWAATFPVMPGLGNLGPHYGFNSSTFLYLAAVSIGNFPGFHIALGLLILVLLFEVSFAARQLTRPGRVTGSRMDAYLCSLLVLPILVLAAFTGFSTTAYDLVPFVLAIVISRQLLALLDGDGLSTTEVVAGVFTIALLGFAAITSKVSIGVFSAVAVSLALLAAFRTTHSKRVLVTCIGVVVTTGGVIIGPWLVRSAILTGYPLYPDPMFGLPFEWSMPATNVLSFRDLIYDFARMPGPGYAGASKTLAWLGPWLASSWRDLAAPALFACAMPFAVLAAAPKLARSLGRRWLVLTPVWLALLAWFVTAPTPRFAGSLLWLAAAVPVAFWLTALPRMARLLLVAVFCAAVEMPNAALLISLFQLSANELTGQYAAIEDPPSVPLRLFTTASGLELYVPADGGDQVWDAPLPSTPYPNPAVRLRCPGTLACGFAAHP